MRTLRSLFIIVAALAVLSALTGHATQQAPPSNAGTRRAFGPATGVAIVNSGAREPDVMPLVVDFHHVHMNVLDPDKSASFYVTHFNAKSLTIAGWRGVQTETAYILFEKVAKPAPYEWDTAIWHFGWLTKSPADDYKRIVAAGVKFFRVPPPSAHAI